MKADIEKQLTEILEEYADNLTTLKDAACEACAKESVQQLKGSSPVGTGPKAGRYARGWRAKETEDGWVVHNATDYQLTHLLNNGHDIYINGNYVGYYEGDNHIGKVEEAMIEKFEETITRKLS